MYAYRYDGAGQRALKQRAALTATSYLRELGQLLSELEEEGAHARWTVDHLYPGAPLLAAVRPETRTAEYFADMTLSGPPASTVEEVSAFIDHNWGDAGPENLPVDGFSARFTRTLAFPAGTYRFTVVTDDGTGCGSTINW